MKTETRETCLSTFASESNTSSENEKHIKGKKMILMRYSSSKSEESLSTLNSLEGGSGSIQRYSTFDIEERQQSGASQNRENTTICGDLHWEYAGIVLTNILHVIATATAQIMGLLFPLFQLNLLRCATQVAMTVPVMLFHKQSPSPTIEDFFKLCGAGALYTVYMVLYFFAATYVPIGSLLAVWMTACLCTRAVHIIWHRIGNLEFIISVLVAIAGLIVLIVPDYALQEANSSSLSIPCPCLSMSVRDYSENRLAHLAQSNGSHSEAIIHDTHMIPDTCWSGSLSWNVWNYFGLRSQVWETLRAPWMGYLLAAVSGLAHTLCFGVVEGLRQSYHYSVLVFWLGALSGIASLLGLIAAEGAAWPLDAACALIAILHCACAASDSLLSLWLYGAASDENLVMIAGGSVTLGFILQSTALAGVLPWVWQRWNVLGAAILLAGLLFSPLSTLWMQRQGSAYSSLR